MFSGNGTSTKVMPRCLFLRVKIFLRDEEEYVELLGVAVYACCCGGTVEGATVG